MSSSLQVVGLFYWAALVFGLGALVVQLWGSASADADADAGDAGTDADGADEEAPGAGPLWILLSLRFWVFATLAFGMTGILLGFVLPASPVPVLLLALLMGFLSGGLASWVFRALSQHTPTSSSAEQELVGRVGRLLLPCSKEIRGKVRVEHKGRTLDLLATTSDEPLEAGSFVLVEDFIQGVAKVSRAPRELLP